MRYLGFKLWLVSMLINIVAWVRITLLFKLRLELRHKVSVVLCDILEWLHHKHHELLFKLGAF